MRYGRGTAKVTQLDGPLVTEQQVFHLQNSEDSPYELGVQRPRPRERCRDKRGSPEHSEGPSANGNTQNLNFLRIQVSTCTFTGNSEQ